MTRQTRSRRNKRRYKRKYKRRYKIKYKSRRYRKKRTKKKAPRRKNHSTRKHRRSRRRRGGNGKADWAKKFHEEAEKNPSLQEAIETWGKPGTKSKDLSQLYKEVKSGDCTVEFTDHGPIRVINVVQMEIYPTAAQEYLLKERKHFPPEHTPDNPLAPIKERDMLFSEKIQGKENATDAALRGIKEELGHSHTVHLITEPTPVKENKTDSYSYTGLPGVYRYFLGKAIVEGLPTPPEHQSFQTTEFNTDHSKKRIIEWAWVPHTPPPTAAAAAATKTTADN